jgi:ribosome-associated heat shock protein Hsp15
MADMRLDKWLWAARFFKSRTLAATACDGGKVDLNEQAAKPSRAVRPGDLLRITLPRGKRIVRVALLSERRGPGARPPCSTRISLRLRRLAKRACCRRSSVPAGSADRPSGSAGSSIGWAAPEFFSVVASLPSA